MDDFYFLGGEVANLDSQDKLHEAGEIAIKIEIATRNPGFLSCFRHYILCDLLKL